MSETWEKMQQAMREQNAILLERVCMDCGKPCLYSVCDECDAELDRKEL